MWRLCPAGDDESADGGPREARIKASEDAHADQTSSAALGVQANGSRAPVSDASRIRRSRAERGRARWTVRAQPRGAPKGGPGSRPHPRFRHASPDPGPRDLRGPTRVGVHVELRPHGRRRRGYPCVNARLRRLGGKRYHAYVDFSYSAAGRAAAAGGRGGRQRGLRAPWILRGNLVKTMATGRWQPNKYNENAVNKTRDSTSNDYLAVNGAPGRSSMPTGGAVRALSGRNR